MSLTLATVLMATSQGFTVQFVTDTEPTLDGAYYYNESEGITRQCIRLNEENKILTVCQSGIKQYIVFVK